MAHLLSGRAAHVRGSVPDGVAGRANVRFARDSPRTELARGRRRRGAAASHAQRMARVADHDRRRAPGRGRSRVRSGDEGTAVHDGGALCGQRRDPEGPRGGPQDPASFRRACWSRTRVDVTRSPPGRGELDASGSRRFDRCVPTYDTGRSGADRERLARRRAHVWPATLATGASASAHAGAAGADRGSFGLAPRDAVAPIWPVIRRNAIALVLAILMPRHQRSDSLVHHMAIRRDKR